MQRTTRPKMHLCLPAAVLFLSAACLLSCGKFDRSKIKMPKFTFVTSDNIHSIAWVDAKHLWVSGNYGTIRFSPDGGQTWEKQDSGLTDNLLGSIRFIDERRGWAAGVAGTIIHTEDGGKTWKPQKSGTDRDLLDLFMLDGSKGWAVGEFGTVIHTADGGATWASQLGNQDRIFNSVFFADNASGWIVGEFGAILHTTDGGATWVEQKAAPLGSNDEEEGWEKPRPALYGLNFTDASHGYIVGMDGIILETSDAGANWKKLDSGTDKPLYSIAVRGRSLWVVGNKGVYLSSSDGGATWSVNSEAIKTKFWLRDVAFYDEKNGLVVGARGTIVQTADGGATWKILSGFRYDMEEFGLADF